MPVRCDIDAPHPFSRDRGTSQSERRLPALDPDRVQIDARTLADLLTFIEQFSRQVIFADVPDANDADVSPDRLITTDWSRFFADSLPFLIARLSSTNVPALRIRYDERHHMAERTRTPDTLRLYIRFIADELLKPLLGWQRQLAQADCPLHRLLDHDIRQQLGTSMTAFGGVSAAQAFISLANGAAYWYGTGQPDLNWPTGDEVWQLELDDLYGVNDGFRSEPTYRKRTERLVNELNAVAQAVLSVTQQFITAAPGHFNDSLEPLRAEYRQQHTPHLGLLFAFLTLFESFRQTLNGLTERHLAFFIKNVLRITPRTHVPDRVHLVLTLAKKKPYQVRSGTGVRGNKDRRNADVIFNLDNDIVLDRAQVVSQKTLFLNPVANETTSFVEGVYMAPDATMADGTATPFAANASSFWPTFGHRDSRHVRPGQTTPDTYPPARLGWLFASPVLLLNEGQRTITICILTQPCAGSQANWWLNNTSRRQITNALTGAFRVSLSGKKGWLIAKNVQTSFHFAGDAVDGCDGLTPTGDAMLIQLNFTLAPTDDAVTFFDKEVLKEDYETTLPLVKIELDGAARINVPTSAKNPACSLVARPGNDPVSVSLYHYLRYQQVADVRIGVQVCGVKSLIVQNDENVQDVNSPIYPFGPRPKKGASFYVGCPEVFGKNWSGLCLNTNWVGAETIIKNPASTEPDKSNLHTYYHGYEDLAAGITADDLKNDQFTIKTALLQNGIWRKRTGGNQPLFGAKTNTICPTSKLQSNYDYSFTRTDFPAHPPLTAQQIQQPATRLEANTLSGFLRLTLMKQDFQHERYSFVLARQMMALGKYPNLYVGPVYDGTNVAGDRTLPTVDLLVAIQELIRTHEKLFTNTPNIKAQVDTLVNAIRAQLPLPTSLNITNAIARAALGIPLPPLPAVTPGAQQALNSLKTLLDPLVQSLKTYSTVRVVIPNEPYTPVFNAISLDYTASASANEIDFIHLHPYADTYQTRSLTAQPRPTLLPTFANEGHLFLGFNDLRPGGTVNLLFQLAEATADAELDQQPVAWAYLVGNDWHPLRPGFELLHDDTRGLTRSGIVQLSIPADLLPPADPRNHTTILPRTQNWLRASVCSNARAIADTVGIHTQAVRASFALTPDNDPDRLALPLPAEQLATLAEADANVSGVSQPYASMGGIPAERIGAGGLFGVRVSEHLRHKGRAIGTFDYERLVLDAFPAIFRAKCISHSLGLSASRAFPCETNPCAEPVPVVANPCQPNRPPSPVPVSPCAPAHYRHDLNSAPGFVLVAVIPDVSMLTADARFGPTVPVSLLTDVDTYLRTRTSPFVRLKVMNPRYERVNICLKVALRRGFDEAYYSDQLKQDLRLFFSPWATGNLDQLTFGRAVRQADLVVFLEQQHYVDFIDGLVLQHEDTRQTCPPCTDLPTTVGAAVVEPLTPRSILIAGAITLYLHRA